MTFLDDPLRVLRAVRFASRFDLQLDASLRAAVELDEVKVSIILYIDNGMRLVTSAHVL